MYDSIMGLLWLAPRHAEVISAVFVEDVARAVCKVYPEHKIWRYSISG